MISIPSRHLVRHLHLDGRQHIALVGGGGKSTTLFSLSSQLTGRIIATTTTKMGGRQTGNLEVLTNPTDDEVREATRRQSIFVRSAVRDGKSIGVASERCDRWFTDAELCDSIVVEADGARHRPFKAPGPLEPVIPATATVLMSLIGADAIGRVIADQCQRPLRVAALAKCSPYERLTPERAATVLLDSRGSAKSLPEGARHIVVITKVPTVDRDPVTHDLAASLYDLLAHNVEVAAIDFELPDYPRV